MANVPPVVTPLVPLRGSALYTWTLAHGDTPVAVEIPAGRDISVYVGGTFASATVTLQGSNDGTNYLGLNDTAGSAISKSSAGLSMVKERTRYYKPAFSGGGGTEALVVSLFVTV
jgi:hypothetical protein